MWENSTNDKVINSARIEILRSWQRTCEVNGDHPNAELLYNPKKLPGFLDPFAGGGSLPLEALRLGFESKASDLNPVAVLINKALIEIPPIFAGNKPVNPEIKKQNKLFSRDWSGAEGLAEDIRYYGQWIRDEAEKTMGINYPTIQITNEIIKDRPELRKDLIENLNVSAWLWTRTIKSPNPAFSQVFVPLVSTFILSTTKGKEAYIEPIVDRNGYTFRVKIGKPKDIATIKNGTKISRGANFFCLMSKSPMSQDYIRGEFRSKRNGETLMAIIAEGDREKIYLSPTKEHEAIARNVKPIWFPELEMNQNSSDLVSGRGYGITNWSEIFTSRQLFALSTFSDLVLKLKK